MMATKYDTNNKSKSTEKEEVKTRYEGPTYERTEDWVKNHPLPDEVKNAFERTNLGMQGKRAYRLKKKI